MRNLDLIRKITLFIISLFLIASIFFSLKSFTGYVISDRVDSSLNIVSFAFFLAGLCGVIFYITKLKIN